MSATVTDSYTVEETRDEFNQERYFVASPAGDWIGDAHDTWESAQEEAARLSRAEARVFFAYSSEAVGSDPHAVKVALGPADLRKWQDTLDREWHLGRYELGSYVTVTDLLTGSEVQIASAPCGLGCHCAAVVRDRETP